ncbi:MAG: hypothetical protein KJ065_09275 [Anaerolineae bacterium]|nr:hypothetical protein [Anaerolineae bacterium]
MLSITSETLTPLWDGVNTQLPTFLGVFAIGGGIAIAVVVSRGLINTIVNALKGALGGGK